MPLIVRKLLIIQLVVMLITMAVVFLITDFAGACAALIGGVIGLVSTWISAKITFAGGPVQSPKKAYRALMLGEVFKFGAVITALTAAFLIIPGQAGPLLGGLAVTLLSNRLGMIWSDGRDFRPRA